MSLQNLTTGPNDLNLFCNTMTCQSIGANCINHCANEGSGAGVFDSVTGSVGNKTANFKSLVAGSGVSITNNSDNLTISSTGSTSPVQSVFTRTGNVVAQSGDYNLNQLSGVFLSLLGTSQVLTYDGTNFTNQYITNPSADFIVYVNKSGNDSIANGSINNPYLTISAAMTSITYATATQRVIISLGSGVYSDSFSLKANVFIIGTESISTKLTGTIDINNSTWNNGNDNRSGFSNVTLLNAITFDFTLQSATAGKIYCYDCWFDGLVTMTADGPINQSVIFNCIFFGGWTQNGMTGVLNNCTFFGGNIIANSSSVGATDLQLDSTVCAGNLTITSTSAQSIEVDLYSSFIPGTISVTGSGAVLKYTVDSIPTTGISISGGATATNLNSISSNLISEVIQSSPGSYNITVPTGAKTAIINAVGAGGAGANPSGSQGGGGGGAGGGIVNFPIGVSAGQIIAVSIGTGGATPGTNGTDTTINLGTFTITCSGGQGGQLAVPSGNGGNGGSVILPTGTITGGSGGIAGLGANGNVGFFAYSGAGGGAGANGGPTFNGGAQLLFTGGTGNSRQGGGGASCFANGGSYNVSPGGSLGSGGPGDVNGIFAGGDGFVSIAFYS